MSVIRLLSLLYIALAFIVTVTTERRLLPFLRHKAGQPIYEEGPSWHKKKQGTPTLGGIGFFLSVSIVFCLALFFLFREKRSSDVKELSLIYFYASLHALLGFSDDCIKLRKKQNGGLTPLQKIVFQFLFSALYLFARAKWIGDSTNLVIGNLSIPLGVFYYPVMLFLMIGIVNCANLTDGIDGLAAGVAFSVGITLLFVSLNANLPVLITASVLIGTTLGFLLFNLHPAQIFMGDTGSLFLGALLVGCSFSLHSPLLMLPLGFVYILEGVSVVLQVVYFKITKERLFLMAPFHHHLEKKGWSENRICISAILLTLLLSIPAFFLFFQNGSH